MFVVGYNTLAKNNLGEKRALFQLTILGYGPLLGGQGGSQQQEHGIAGHITTTVKSRKRCMHSCPRRFAVCLRYYDKHNTEGKEVR